MDETSRAWAYYSKNPPPAFLPHLMINQTPSSSFPLTRSSSTTSPFENLAAARLPFSSTCSTFARANDIRNAGDRGVQFGISLGPTRIHVIRSQAG